MEVVSDKHRKHKQGVWAPGSALEVFPGCLKRAILQWPGDDVLKDMEEWEKDEREKPSVEKHQIAMADFLVTCFTEGEGGVKFQVALAMDGLYSHLA